MSQKISINIFNKSLLPDLFGADTSCFISNLSLFTPSPCSVLFLMWTSCDFELLGEVIYGAFHRTITVTIRTQYLCKLFIRKLKVKATFCFNVGSGFNTNALSVKLSDCGKRYLCVEMICEIIHKSFGQKTFQSLNKWTWTILMQRRQPP